MHLLSFSMVQEESLGVPDTCTTPSRKMLSARSKALSLLAEATSKP